MMDNTDDYIYFKDRNHVFTGASQALTEITESVKHWTEFLGVTDYDVFAEEYADIYYSLEKQVFSGQKVAHDIQETLLQDGRKGWINNRKYPIRSEDGDIVGLFGMARDITQSKLAEQALQISEESLRKTQEIAGIGGFVLDVKTGNWTSTRVLDEILGIEHEYNRSVKGWEALIHPEDLHLARLDLRRKIADKSLSYDRNYRIVRHSDKKERYVRGMGRLLLDSKGRALQIIGTIQDITDTREEYLAEKNAVLSNQIVGVVTINNRKVMWANAAFEKMLGYNKGELTGVSTRKLYASEQGYQDVGAVYSDKEHQETVHVEQQLVRKDGRSIWVDMSTAVLPNKNGDSLWTFIDTTKRRQVQEALRQSEFRWKFALEGSGDGLWDWDLEAEAVYYSKIWKEMLGYSEAEIGDGLGEWKTRLHPEDIDEALADVQDHLAGKTSAYINEHRMLCKDGKYKWMLARGLVVSRDENKKPLRMIGTYTDITDRKHALQEIEHLAFYDHLTQLPNRRLLLDRLNHALTTSTSSCDGAILFIDLDHFKTVNDVLSHVVGDMLLQQVAKRISACISKGGMLARLGGDEYIVLLENLSGDPHEAAAQAKAIGDNILLAISQPYELETHGYQCTASIGVALLSEHKNSKDDLLKHADIAMYQAKQSGRNTIRFFNPEMQEAIHTRVDIEHELHRAIREQHFKLHYQIQVDEFDQPVGTEALIRWIHPERGILPPYRFISLAEEVGLIIPIGQWVLETACAQLQAWQSDEVTRNLSISINVSSKQLLQDNFVAQVRAAVMKYSINPLLLKLELTESMLIDNVESTIRTMMALKTIGVSFELDDFGTGYSSLQYLKRLPLDRLKIDQSFVRDISNEESDKAIVRTVIAMAHGLNLEVIAEGVETEEQRQLLIKKGCKNFQGYLFGKPMPINELEAVIKDRVAN